MGRYVPAARAVFHETYGYFPRVVRHSCDNHRCVNPDHLLPGDQKLNARDMMVRGRGCGLLTADQVRYIRNFEPYGYGSARDLGRQLGVRAGLVSAVRNGYGYRWVDTEKRETDAD